MGVLAISGIPPFAGFFSKDGILSAAYAQSPIVWGVALLTSLMTVFYMFRLFFLIFYGTSRTDKEKIEHVHEAPKSMAVPLIILGVLSAIGGFMNVPESLWGTESLATFLSPVFEGSEGLMVTHHLTATTEYALMAIVLMLTLVLVGIAYLRYVKKNSVPAAEGAEAGFAFRLSYHKFYVDEIYSKVILQPIVWLSSKLEEIVERLGIDALVNASGSLVLNASNVFRRFQTGRIGFYIFIMVLGIVAMLAVGFIEHG
jgi:NADH-quinone oxidoreductase subunit L